jgi:hypothetical protein
MLSDFAAVDDAQGIWLAPLARGSEVVLVNIYDPLEAVPPPPGRYPVTDGVRDGMLDTTAGELRTGWRRRFSTHIETLESLCQRHRAHLVNIASDQPLTEALDLGLGTRRRQGGASR